MQTIKLALRWILVSSADPRKVSLTVQAALIGMIPFTMQALGMVCALGYVCYDLDQSLFEALAESIANMVFYALTLLSAIGVAWGLVRKVYLSITGENQALK